MKRVWFSFAIVLTIILLFMLCLLTDGSEDYSGGTNYLNYRHNHLTAFGDFDYAGYSEQVDYIIIAFYTIEDGELGELWLPELEPELYYSYEEVLNLSLDELAAMQENLVLFDEIWQMVTAIIPEAYLDQVAYLELFTDGYDNFLGAVEEVDYGSGSFILSLDLDDLLDENLAIRHSYLSDTIIHELAHLITLSDDQVAWVEEEDSDPRTYFIFEYDLDTYEHSYMNLFFQQFWPDIFDEWSSFYYEYGVIYEGEEHLAEENENILTGYLDTFYEKYSDRFVSEYAATSPTEDIAETFIYFVTDDLPDGSLIRHQKVLFFYNFPELVVIRDQIREYLTEQEVLQ